jgi:hypothetical protein
VPHAKLLIKMLNVVVFPECQYEWTSCFALKVLSRPNSAVCCLFRARFLIRFLFDPEDVVDVPPLISVDFHRTTKIELLDIGWGGVDWIGLAQDRGKRKALANAVMNLGVP